MEIERQINGLKTERDLPISVYTIDKKHIKNNKKLLSKCIIHKSYTNVT